MALRPQYGPAHKAERERWEPVVDQGDAWCAEVICLVERDGGDRWIPPGTEWHLAHDRNVPGTYRGPAHARCNLSEGGKAAHELAPIVWEL